MDVDSIGPLAKLRLWAHLTRVGVDPLTLPRKKLTGRHDISLKGVRVDSPNPPLTYKFAKMVWGGEYDFPGCIPKQGWTVVDIGGNVGLFAMLAASRGASVRSYEPHPDLVEFMARNTARWGVECIQAAVVADDRTTVRLTEHPTLHIKHTTTGRDSIGGAEIEGYSFEVPAVRFADVVRGADLVKLDAEGAEYELLADTAALDGIGRLVGEAHRDLGDADALLDGLRKQGYRVDAREERDGHLVLFSARR